MLTPLSTAFFLSLQINFLNLVLSSRPLFTLHRTDWMVNDFQYDCLYYYVHANQQLSLPTQQIIEYCLRPETGSGLSKEKNDSPEDGFTFSILRSKNITSQQLYAWSAPIDLVENYQIYFDNIPSPNLTFYNCTPPYFGYQCMYTFALNDPYISLANVVEKTFMEKLKFDGILSSIVDPICYTHIQCDHGLSLCLDWRDICDGKVDCTNGGPDEANCFALEYNECIDETEYRCHNGAHCIPSDWLNDDKNNFDCLDRSDEQINSEKACITDPAIRCEDRTHVLTKFSSFSCGDGAYTILYDCLNQRGEFALYTWLEKSLFEAESNKQQCDVAMMCKTQIAYPTFPQSMCDSYCEENSCEEVIKQYCPPLFFFPPFLRLHGHVRFLFSDKPTNITDPAWISTLAYICYRKELCENTTFLTKPPEMWFDGLACSPLSDISLRQIDPNDSKWMLSFQFLIEHIHHVFHSCLSIISTGTDQVSNHNGLRNLYQCAASKKFISYHRLIDDTVDCPLGDDETDPFNKGCSINNYRFTCRHISDGDIKCHPAYLKDQLSRTCSSGNGSLLSTYPLPIFPLLCDGNNEQIAVTLDGLQYTDETECEHFPCNNTYTRCDDFWSCANGADEVNCQPSTCPPLQHMCVFPTALALECLPINRSNDGIVDCLGASDERQHCRKQGRNPSTRYRCWNSTICISFTRLCDKVPHCPLSDDEIFCESQRNFETTVCIPGPQTPVENFLCNTHDASKLLRRYLSVHEYAIQYVNLATKTSATTKMTLTTTKRTLDNILIYDDIDQKVDSWAWYCNRGLLLRDVAGNELKCLCPPAYFGDLCQFHSERITITLQLLSYYDIRSVFAIVLTLLKDESIETHEHVMFLPSRDCNMKFYLNLLHSSRPRNVSARYAVRIQIFDKQSLMHRTSWIYPLQFAFLPVIPVVALLRLIPDQQEICSHKCSHHGSCTIYQNSKSNYCRCHPGWTGLDCSEPSFHCNQCSPGSLCLGSMCLCALGKFGPRCYLVRSSCDPNPCLNGGLCVPDDERVAEDHFVCICREANSGKRCELSNTFVTISMEHIQSIIPFSILIHFIEVFEGASQHKQTTAFKKIPVDRNTVTLYWADPFHLVFIQLSDSYFFSLVQEIRTLTGQITIPVNASQQCRQINELFNQTILKRPIIRRIKLYHIPCREQPELACFYDESYMCYCNRLRLANCFEFNQNITFKCFGYNYCKNGGSCFQQNGSCPQTIRCGCPECYFGSRCQFSTKGHGIPLDSILGSYIRSDLTFNQQSTVVKVSMAATFIIWTIGIINGVLTMITFQNKTPTDVGCRLYMFSSGLVSIFTISIFLIKFILLFLSQSNLISNQSFLAVHCLLTDFLLRLFQTAGNWLNACVAAERMVIVAKGTGFNRKKSMNAVKWIILLVLLFTLFTTLHEPFHRHLVNDKEEKRIWCVAEYSLVWQHFDSTAILFNFIASFMVNIISILFIIISTTYQRTNMLEQLGYINYFKHQLYKHRHLFISQMILVVLSLPRLIISLLPGCLKSQRNPWLFLVGYYVSYLPSTLTFIVFVLPFKTNRNAFCMSMTSMKRVCQRLMSSSKNVSG